MQGKLIMATALAIMPSVAMASSPAAWDALNAKVTQSCISASKLQQARSGQVIGFDDTLGKFVTLVTGTARISGGKKTTVSMLCVYDPQSGATWVAEAKGWKAPPG